MVYEKECYVVIIGDIVDSRNLADREEVQKKFKEALNFINQKYSMSILAKFKITLGDEFQGLLRSRQSILDIITDFELYMLPVRFRYGIGIGDIDTEINYEDSAEIDGSAYHRAREMINALEDKKGKYNEEASDIMICSGEIRDERDDLMNSLLAVCSALKSKWTERQKEIICTYIQNGENQYKTAEILEIAQSSVNRALQNARFYAYKSAMDTITSVLREAVGEAYG